MAVNSFNPRLFSSSSSENEVEDVFRHKAGAVVPVDVTLPSAKNRCFSEPGHQNGRDGMKEDGRSFGKTPALSDSSNVLRRHKGRLALQNGNEKPSVVTEAKNELFSPISEENSSQLSPDYVRSKSDGVFPEPESSRNIGRDSSYRYSFLLEDVDSLGDGLMPNLGRVQDLGEGGGIMEFNDEQQQINGMENDDVFMRDLGSDGVADINAQEQVLDEDDDSYPEKESFPPGYASCFLGDLPYISYPWDLPRTVLRSYSSLDLENVPELPDDLIKDTTAYPDIDKDYESLSPALVPSTPITPSDYEMKMRQLFGEDY